MGNYGYGSLKSIDSYANPMFHNLHAFNPDHNIPQHQLNITAWLLVDGHSDPLGLAANTPDISNDNGTLSQNETEHVNNIHLEESLEDATLPYQDEDSGVDGIVSSSETDSEMSDEVSIFSLFFYTIINKAISLNIQYAIMKIVYDAIQNM